MLDIVTKVRRGLKSKLQFEKRLKEKLIKFNKSVVRRMINEYVSTGSTLNMNEYNKELGGILFDHYQVVAASFVGLISAELPDDVALTEQERNEINSLLTSYFFDKATDTAKKINDTTQDNIILSIEQAHNDELTEGQTELGLRVTVGVIAGNILREKLKNRVDTIALSETQLPAEVAKATESEVLSGQPIGAAISKGRKRLARKEWVTVGDEKVRRTHARADGQIRIVGRPYRVGGEDLFVPRDESLGATAGNTINCRCSSEVDVESVIDVRRAKK